MPSLDLTAAEDILKTDYQDGLRDQLNEINVVWAQFDKRKTPHRGKDFYLALRNARNEGTGFRAENGTLPVAGSQGYENAIYAQKYQYTRIRLTGQVIEAAVGDKSSFVDALDSELNGGVEDTARDTNRVMWNNSEGALSTASGGPATSTAIASAKFFQIGQLVDLITLAGAKNGDLPTTGAFVVAVDRTAGAATVDVSATAGGAAISVTVAAGERFTRAGSNDLEANGLANIIADDNTLGQIDRTVAANEFWKAVIVDKSSDTLASNFEDFLEEAMDEQEIQGSGKINFIVMSHEYRREFAAELQTIRQFTGMAAIDLKGGFKGLDFNGVPIANDRDASGADGVPFRGITGELGSAYLMDLNSIFVMQTDEYKWIDSDGHILYRSSGGDVDAVEATFRKYFNVGTDRSNSLVNLKLPIIV